MAFGEDAYSNLYLVDLDGDVFRLTPTATSLDAGDLVRAGTGDDAVFSGEGDDVIFGGDGLDRLLDGPGADVLLGGPGFDLADYSTSAVGARCTVANWIISRATG